MGLAPLALIPLALAPLGAEPSGIDALGEGDDAAMIVRTIIGLAHNLGLEIVAEGVETPRQLAIVRGFACDQVQGYLVGRPIRMDDPDELTAARARAMLFGGLKPGQTHDAEMEHESRSAVMA